MNPLAALARFISGANLPPEVVRAAGRWGAHAFDVNQVLEGFGAAINFQIPITPTLGGPIFALGSVTARCTGFGTTVTTKVRRNGILIPAPTPMISITDSGTSNNGSVSGLVYALDTPQPAGVPVTYSVTMATVGQTLGAGPGQMALFLLELG